MSDISASAITTDAEFEKQIAGASFEEIKVLMAQRAVQQGLVQRDIYDSSVLIPTELASAAPRQVGKVVVLNGVKHTLTADDEAGLLAQENALYKQAMQPAVTTQQTEQPRDTSTGRFTSSAEPVVSDEQKAALSIQFQLGQITASEYIEKSGAVADYLEKAGVPMEDLQAAVADKRNQRVEQSWKEGTDAFLSSPEGRDWPGGEENMRLVGEVIQSQGWTDIEDKQAALAAAAKYLRENDLLVTPASVVAHNREVELSQQINETNDPYTLRDMLQPGSGLFGR